MKRWLFNLAAALSLLLALAAVAAWATSYLGSPTWRLIGSAHSADLTRVPGEKGALHFITTANWSKSPHFGFWDAWWAVSESGRLTLLAQVIDYERTLRRVYSAPPTLTVDPPGQARSPAVVFGPGSKRLRSWLGFAWNSDAERVQGDHGPVTARAWMVTFPYWFIVLLGLPIPLLWLRRRKAQSAS